MLGDVSSIVTGPFRHTPARGLEIRGEVTSVNRVSGFFGVVRGVKASRGEGGWLVTRCGGCLYEACLSPLASRSDIVSVTVGTPHGTPSFMRFSLIWGTNGPSGKAVWPLR